MKYTTLGKTGLQISRLGFGGIPIQKVDAETTRTLVKAMVEKGINYIDTARGYTVSEEFLGYALEGLRDKFILATKSMSRTREAMAADIDISLNNLKTDYIDLYQVHNPTAEQLDQVVAPGGALEALMEAKAAGKIGHIGLYRDEETFEPHEYFCKLPAAIDERKIFVVDPMLATGGSAIDAINAIKERGGKDITFLCIIAAPEGLEKLSAAHPDVKIYVGNLDRELNENAYICPGLGDAGDRIFGTK